MAAEGLKTEVSTDILLVQSGEEGRSGVLFVVGVAWRFLTLSGRYQCLLQGAENQHPDILYSL